MFVCGGGRACIFGRPSMAVGEAWAALQGVILAKEEGWQEVALEPGEALSGHYHNCPKKVEDRLLTLVGSSQMFFIFQLVLICFLILMLSGRIIDSLTLFAHLLFSSSDVLEASS